MTRIRKYHPGFTQFSNLQTMYYNTLPTNYVSPIWSEEEETFDLNDRCPDPDDYYTHQRLDYNTQTDTDFHDGRSDYADQRPKWLDQSDDDVPFYWS
jgi:hypothetical protein